MSTKVVDIMDHALVRHWRCRVVRDFTGPLIAPTFFLSKVFLVAGLINHYKTLPVNIFRPILKNNMTSMAKFTIVDIA